MSSNIKTEGAPLERSAFRFFKFKSVLPALPFLIIFSFFFIYPISKLIYVSFMSNENNFTFGNYQTAFTEPYSTGFINSIKIAFFSALITALPGAIAAYFIETRGPSKVRRSLAMMGGRARKHRWRATGIYVYCGYWNAGNFN